MTQMSEELARRILQAAIDEGRCAEFAECLFDGGSATVDATTGKLVLVSGDGLASMFNHHEGAA